MRSIGIAFGVIAFFVVSLCAQEAPNVPQQSAANQPNGTIYIYRYKQFVGGGLEPSVYCDETPLARMDNGRYFIVEVEPGKHTLRSNDKQSGLELDVKAGEKYFVRVEIATGMLKGHGRLVLMAPEQGSYELKSKKLKPLDPGKVLDKARVSVAEISAADPKP